MMFLFFVLTTKFFMKSVAFKATNMNRFVCFGSFTSPAHIFNYAHCVSAVVFSTLSNRNMILSASLRLKIFLSLCVHALFPTWLRKFFP